MKKKKTKRKLVRKIKIGRISWMEERLKYLKRLRKAGIKGPGLKYRFTGRTTARVLEVIALAINNPERLHKITDHEIEGVKPSRDQLTYALTLCIDTVKKLGLEGFSFSLIGPGIKFSLKP